jgi:hypothetical protein
VSSLNFKWPLGKNRFEIIQSLLSRIKRKLINWIHCLLTWWFFYMRQRRITKGSFVVARNVGENIVGGSHCANRLHSLKVKVKLNIASLLINRCTLAITELSRLWLLSSVYGGVKRGNSFGENFACSAHALDLSDFFVRNACERFDGSLLSSRV